MSLVLVERRFPQPVGLEEIHAREQQAAWCFEAHQVRPVMAYLSTDRTRMACLFDAPDAEAVRRSQDKAGLPYEAAWAARPILHEDADTPAEVIVVVRTLPEPVDEAGAREAAARGAWCLEQRGCRSLRSFLAAGGRRMVCVYAGPDAESVREAQKRVGLPFDEAWPAGVVVAASPPGGTGGPSA